MKFKDAIDNFSFVDNWYSYSVNNRERYGYSANGLWKAETSKKKVASNFDSRLRQRRKARR